MSISFERLRTPDLGFSATESRPPESTAPAADPKESFSAVLSALGQRIDQGEQLVTRASRSELGALDAGALIAVQAGIYRYVEAVDLASKLVDRASNAVRTVLQSGQ